MSSKYFLKYEQDQRRRTLAVIVWVVLAAAIILGLFDIQFNTWVSVIALFGTAVLCIPILVLNAKGYFSLAAFLLSFVILVVITVNMYDGNGVHDPGLLAYTIFIMVGTLLFGKRASPYFALATIGSLTLIVWLEIFKYIHPKIGPTTFGILIPTITLLLVSAMIIWVIVENIEKNLKRARDSEAELRQNYDLTLKAWAKVLEYRDRETEGHSRRLVKLSDRLGRALGLSEEELVHLRRGALIHDIGKLAIPDEVLLKPDVLDENERELIRKHTIYARQMLSEIAFLQPAISVAYSHHESWDGQGYPEGMKGEEIPLLARLFAVVDTWDALRSERVYRPAWSAEKTAAYLKENAGIKYDPHIVEVFLDLI